MRRLRRTGVDKGLSLALECVTPHYSIAPCSVLSSIASQASILCRQRLKLLWRLGPAEEVGLCRPPWGWRFNSDHSRPLRLDSLVNSAGHWLFHSRLSTGSDRHRFPEDRQKEAMGHRCQRQGASGALVEIVCPSSSLTLPHNQAQVDTPSTLSDSSHTNHAALRHSRSPGKFAGQGCPQCCGSLHEGFGPHFHRPGGFSQDVCPGLRFSCAGRGCEESGCWVPASSPTVPGLYPAARRFPPIFPHLVSCYSWECLLADDLSQCVFHNALLI